MDGGEDRGDKGEILVRGKVEVKKKEGWVGGRGEGVVEASLGMAAGGGGEQVVRGAVDFEDRRRIEDKGASMVFVEVVEGNGVRAKARESGQFGGVEMGFLDANNVVLEGEGFDVGGEEVAALEGGVAGSVVGEAVYVEGDDRGQGADVSEGRKWGAWVGVGGVGWGGGWLG